MTTAKTIKNKPKKKIGRKWFDGKDEKEVLAKFMEVWGIGGTDAEAAFYADVSKDSISRYVKQNPNVSEIREKLKEKPILKARKAVFAGLDTYANGMDYLKRKKKAEFGDSQEITGNLEVTQITGMKISKDKNGD